MNAITLESRDFDPALVRALQGELRRQEEHMDRCSTTSYLSSAAAMQSTACVAQSWEGPNPLKQPSHITR
jgi:hypothetical protein